MSNSTKDNGSKAATPSRNKQKLGRGLGALLGDARREEPLVAPNTASGPPQSGGTTPAKGQPRIVSTGGKSAQVATSGGSQDTQPNAITQLPIAEIEPNPDQPRTHFDDDALKELAASISARGVIQPVIVRPMPGGKYQIVAGERRWRAAQKAQLHEIPAIIRDLDAREVMAIALIENIQREDLNPVEEARAYRALADVEELTQAEIAELVDKSRSHIANMQRLLSLPEAVLDDVASGKLSMGHARALIGRDDAAEIAAQAVKQGLSVREVEKLVRKAKTDAGARNGSKSRAAAQPNADIEAVQNHLEEFLGMSVRIEADADPRSGKLSIRYRTLDQLDLICQRLTGGSI